MKTIHSMDGEALRLRVVMRVISSVVMSAVCGLFKGRLRAVFVCKSGDERLTL